MADTLGKDNNDNKAPVGGEFLISSRSDSSIFTPETFSDEHRQFHATVSDFMRQEVEPRAEDIDHKKPGVVQGLMQQAAELGLLMVDISEDFGGLGLDKVTSMLVAEATATVGSFAVTLGAHTGIGTLPIVYFGTDAQKKEYLPRLANGELTAAYCLSEQGSGSDALAAKTTAVLDGDEYILNGTKAWITNGNFADLFIVFAQIVEGEERKFSAFLVEKTAEGLSIGKEERKLGIRGSSTTLVTLDDVRVSKDALLGEIGRGHKIAFNILNIGRFKLGIGATGASKYALAEGCRYANERRQFKKPISTFGLIREKIARSASLIYATESMAYSLAGNLDQRIGALDTTADDFQKQKIKVIEDFTIEASILKVFGSEALTFVADEMLQVHGGNGFTEDYPIERIFRDARINRIFEGTNEINRLIIPATLFKRALKGQMPLMEFVQQVNSELKDGKLPEKQEGEPLADEFHAYELCQRAIVFASASAAQKYLQALKHQQRLLGAVADAIILLYGMESVVRRARQAVEAKHPQAEMHVTLAKLFCFEARAEIFQHLRRVAMLMAEGEELDRLYDTLGKLDQRYRADVMNLQESVAEAALKDEAYPLPYS